MDSKEIIKESCLGRLVYDPQTQKLYLNFPHTVQQGLKCFVPSDIKDVEFYPPATKMTFRDGTVTTSVAQEGDEFNKEVGMMVCIMKYIFKGKGYNNMFRKWIKNADRREAAKAQEIEKQKEEKAIKERQAAKEAKRRAARAERAREREIEIQKEAYVRAMREVQSDKTEGADA